MPYNHNQLIPQRVNQTSSGVAVSNNIVFDRESGKPIVIQHPSLTLMVSDSSLTFSTDYQPFSQEKLLLLLKCLLILQTLPEPALEEATEDLEGIARFYSNRLLKADVSTLPASSIKGKLRATQVRPPIVLEP
jgi:hypothetical protein